MIGDGLPRDMLIVPVSMLERYAPRVHIFTSGIRRA